MMTGSCIWLRIDGKRGKDKHDINSNSARRCTRLGKWFHTFSEFFLFWSWALDDSGSSDMNSLVAKLSFRE